MNRDSPRSSPRPRNAVSDYLMKAFDLLTETAFRRMAERSRAELFRRCSKGDASTLPLASQAVDGDSTLLGGNDTMGSSPSTTPGRRATSTSLSRKKSVNFSTKVVAEEMTHPGIRTNDARLFWRTVHDEFRLSVPIPPPKEMLASDPSPENSEVVASNTLHVQSDLLTSDNSMLGTVNVLSATLGPDSTPPFVEEPQMCFEDALEMAEEWMGPHRDRMIRQTLTDFQYVGRTLLKHWALTEEGAGEHVVAAVQRMGDELTADAGVFFSRHGGEEVVEEEEEVSPVRSKRKQSTFGGKRQSVFGNRRKSSTVAGAGAMRRKSMCAPVSMSRVRKAGNINAVNAFYDEEDEDFREETTKQWRRDLAPAIGSAGTRGAVLVDARNEARVRDALNHAHELVEEATLDAQKSRVEHKRFAEVLVDPAEVKIDPNYKIRATTDRRSSRVASSGGQVISTVQPRDEYAHMWEANQQQLLTEYSDDVNGVLRQFENGRDRLNKDMQSVVLAAAGEPKPVPKALREMSAASVMAMRFTQRVAKKVTGIADRAAYNQAYAAERWKRESTVPSDMTKEVQAERKRTHQMQLRHRAQVLHDTIKRNHLLNFASPRGSPRRAGTAPLRSVSPIFDERSVQGGQFSPQRLPHNSPQRDGTDRPSSAAGNGRPSTAQGSLRSRSPSKKKLLRPSSGILRGTSGSRQRAYGMKTNFVPSRVAVPDDADYRVKHFHIAKKMKSHIHELTGSRYPDRNGTQAPMAGYVTKVRDEVAEACAFAAIERSRLESLSVQQPRVIDGLGGITNPRGTTTGADGRPAAASLGKAPVPSEAEKQGLETGEDPVVVEPPPTLFEQMVAHIHDPSPRHPKPKVEGMHRQPAAAETQSRRKMGQPKPFMEAAMEAASSRHAFVLATRGAV